MSHSLMNVSSSLYVASAPSDMVIDHSLQRVFSTRTWKGWGALVLLAMVCLGVESRQLLHSEILERSANEYPKLYYERGQALMTEGSPEAIQKGLTLWEQSAENGYSRAACDLAAYYRWMKPDDAQLARWMAPCVESHPTADRETVMGQLYLDGRGVSPSALEAVRWYTQAADHGSEEAQWTLFYIYRDGRGEIAPDHALAFLYASTLMKQIQTNPEAMRFILDRAYEGSPNALAWVCRRENRPNMKTWISPENLSDVCEEESKS